MIFLDHTGHTFEIKDYNKKPIGYDYDVKPYVFWLDSEYTHQLSINNFYILPIRMLVPSNIKNIEINIEDSEIFSLFSTQKMHELVTNMSSLNDYISIKENEFVKKLNEDDLIGLQTETDYIIPFYIVGYSENEDTFITNILIHYTTDNNEEVWCPISVGGTFYNENEFLIINGRNMGVELPKDILGAIYQYSYHSEVPDETLYANKIKEYLLNFMHIKGQIGNFNSVIDSLGWFGYGDKIEIQKLRQTDNEFQDQFFLDDFTISTNLLHSYNSFRASTYISLRLWENQELDETYQQTFSFNEFWGEGKSKLENLFEKTIIRHYDEADIDFYRSYYDYAFDELGLKLAMLDYYFKKYFLPIHLHIHSTSIAHRVFSNDVKMINFPNVHISEKNVDMSGKPLVSFLNKKDYYIFNQEFYVDTNFNNLIQYDVYGENTYVSSYYQNIGKYINDIILFINKPCIEIPIKIDIDGFVQCHLILMKDNYKVFESDFQIFQDNYIRYGSFIILPEYINKDINNDHAIYWLNSNYKIALLVNDKWYYHNFNIKVPEFQMNFGRLIYKYYNSINNVVRVDLNDTNWEAKRHDWGYQYDRDVYGTLEDGSLQEDIDIRYYMDGNKCLHKQLNTLYKDNIDFNVFMYVPSLVEVNDINFYDKLDKLVVDVYGQMGDTKDKDNKGSMSQAGVLTRDKLIEEYRQNTKLSNLSNNGKEIDVNRLLKRGDNIIPQFYFNDYSRDENGNVVEDYYQIDDFHVDLYFGYFKKGNGTAPFAKRTISLVENGEYNYYDPEKNPEGWLYDGSDGIHKRNLVRPVTVRLSDWDQAFAGEDGQYEIIKQFYTEEINQYLEENPYVDILNCEYPFRINQCILESVEQLELRIVWNVKLTCETVYQSSYNKNGQPIDGYYFKDASQNSAPTWKFVTPDKCSMENCFIMKYLSKNGEPLRCKFRTYYDEIDRDVDYNTEIDHDYFGEDGSTLKKRADSIMENLLNQSINNAKSTIIINNNDLYTNRIHIYNLYHLGYTGQIDNITDSDIYSQYDNEETNKKYYDEENLESSLFDYPQSSIIPLAYNKDKYGDYTLSQDEWDKKYPEVKKNLYELYRLFFTEPEGDQRFVWPTLSSYDYDFYLMHDETNWYVVFISQLPISFATEEDLIAPKELEYVDIQGHKFLLKHYRSGNNFLINRMYFESANGINKFSKNDLIVATIDNVKFPFVLEHGAKWEIVPYSLGIDKDACKSVSNANTCIFSIGSKNQTYVKGYYDVNVRYSIDANVQHQQKMSARICITD